MTTPTLLLSLLFPVIVATSTVLFKHALGSLDPRRFGPYQYAFYFAFMTQGLLGMYLALWGARNHLGFRLIQDDIPYIEATLAVIIGAVLTPLSMIAFARVFHFRPAKHSRTYLDQPVDCVLTRSDHAFFAILLIATTVLIGVAAWSLPASPLMLSFDRNANAVDLSRARFEYEFAEQTFTRIFQNIIGSSVSAVIAYVTFSFALSRSALRWRVLFAAQVVPVLLIQTLSMAKASAAQFLLGLVFVYVITKGQISARRAVFAAIGVSAVLLVSYAAVGTDYRAEGSGWSSVLDDDNPIGRVVIGQVAGMPNYFQTFPDQHPFLYGSELQLLALFGERPKTAARISMEAILPDGVLTKTVGMQNTFFTGAAYANFGWLGVLIAPLIVGFVLQATQTLVMTGMRKNPLTIGWGVWTMYQFSKAVGGGFMSEFVVNTNVIGTSAIVAGMFAVAKLSQGVVARDAVLVQSRSVSAGRL